MNLVQAMSEAFKEVTGIVGPHTSPNVAPLQKVSISDELTQIAMLPMPSPEILQEFVQENRVQINSYIFKKITRAIKKDLPEVMLWRIGTSDKFARIDRQDYVHVVNQFREFFIKTEQYEQIPVCDRLIEQHNINRVIYEANEEYKKDK